VESQASIPEVDVHTAAQRRADGAALVDVREPDEYEEVRAEGAVLVPLGDVVDRMGELPRDRPLLLICRSGARSLRAAEFLAGRGFDVANVAGGTLAWVDASLPVERGR
jgi:rhodanese-related sulfurtransferase